MRNECGTRLLSAIACVRNKHQLKNKCAAVTPAIEAMQTAYATTGVVKAANFDKK